MNDLLGVLGLLLCVGHAQAHDGSMKSMLEEGYRIVGVYVFEGETRYVLQKNVFVFECFAHKSETCLLIN